MSLSIYLDPEQSVMDTDTAYHAVHWVEDDTVIVYGEDVVGKAIVQQVVMKAAEEGDELARAVIVTLVVSPA